MQIKKIVIRIIGIIISVFFLYNLFTYCWEYIAFYKKIDQIEKDFSEQELKYFYKIAFNIEDEFKIKRKIKTKLKFWTKDIAIKIHGNYLENDSLELVKIINELNILINTIEISLVTTNNNVDIFFLKQQEFQKYSDNTKDNWGYFRVYYNKQAIILLNENLTYPRRSHILREELTQSLGLCNDTYDYPFSIFYKGYSNVTEYSALDKKLIQLLYNYNLPFLYSKYRFKKKFLQDKN